MVLTSLKSRPPLHREVASIVSEKIISGEFPENSLLPPERELCETMGVSRTVVREAVKFLESRGLVRIERGRGMIVQEAQSAPVTENLKLLLRRRGHVIQDLLEVRKMFEVGIAGLAAVRRTDADLAAMEQALAIMREKPGAPEGYIDADMEFHAEIARASRNPVVEALLEPLTDLLRESRTKSFSGTKMVKIRIGQHEAILDRIKAKDAAGAQQAMLAHLVDTEKDLERHGSLTM
jgi:GntR family transcriptional regulator, transcriptional repressor for pyruvate dehydrogenase complex